MIWCSYLFLEFTAMCHLFSLQGGKYGDIKCLCFNFRKRKACRIPKDKS